jgi:hypothetical protein
MTLSAATPANRRSDQARRSSLPWRHRHPVRTKRAEAPPSPTVLIYGSAIKTPAKLPEFSNMRFSNRRQTGGQAIRSFRLSRPFIIRRSTLITSVLIYGSAIKTSANQPKFNNMQFSNRRQTGGLTITSSFPGKTAPAGHFQIITRHPSLATALIWLSARRMLLCFRPIERANHRHQMAESAQMKPARIE